MSAFTTFAPIHELDERESDGIVIRLFWDEACDHTFVTVRDERNDESFSVSVLPGQSAKDVFNHPFAYR